MTKRDSLALQALVQRVGLAAVLDDLLMLAQEMAADNSRWAEVADALYEAREFAEA